MPGVAIDFVLRLSTPLAILFKSSRIVTHIVETKFLHYPLACDVPQCVGSFDFVSTEPSEAKVNDPTTHLCREALPPMFRVNPETDAPDAIALLSADGNATN